MTQVICIHMIRPSNTSPDNHNTCPCAGSPPALGLFHLEWALDHLQRRGYENDMALKKMNAGEEPYAGKRFQYPGFADDARLLL